MTGCHLVTHLGPTPRVRQGLEAALQKRRPDGLWARDSHPRNPPVPPGPRREPHPWVTLRVLRFVTAAQGAAPDGTREEQEASRNDGSSRPGLNSQRPGRRRDHQLHDERADHQAHQPVRGREPGDLGHARGQEFPKGLARRSFRP